MWLKLTLTGLLVKLTTYYTTWGALDAFLYDWLFPLHSKSFFK